MFDAVVTGVMVETLPQVQHSRISPDLLPANHKLPGGIESSTQETGSFIPFHDLRLPQPQPSTGPTSREPSWSNYSGCSRQRTCHPAGGRTPDTAALVPYSSVAIRPTQSIRMLARCGEDRHSLRRRTGFHLPSSRPGSPFQPLRRWANPQ